MCVCVFLGEETSDEEDSDPRDGSVYVTVNAASAYCRKGNVVFDSNPYLRPGELFSFSKTKHITKSDEQINNSQTKKDHRLTFLIFSKRSIYIGDRP